MARSIRPALRDTLTLILFWLLATAYNLYKPYHIDDAAHLQFAQTFMAHPLHPMTSVLNLAGTPEPIWHFNQPPLYFYLLGVWALIFGYSEPAMHALGAMFALGGIVWFYRIARVICPAGALWLTGMVALGPAFVVGQNLMVDVPLLAVWLLFFDALIVGADHAESLQPRRFITAGAAAGVALMIKYSSLVLPPVLILVLLYERRLRLLWTVFIPFAVMAAWALFNLIEYRHIHMLQRPSHIFRGQPTLPLLRFIGIVVTLGGLTPFGVILVVRAVPGLRRHASVVYSLTIGFIVVLATLAYIGVAETPADKVLRVAFLLNGAILMAGAVLAILGRLTERRSIFVPTPDNIRLMVLLLWIGGHIAFYSLFSPFMAARHVLLVLPALLLIGTRLLPIMVPRIDVIFGLATTIALSVMIGWADWRFAAFFRDEAPAITASLPTGAHIRFNGGWGWQWYALRAGMLPLNTENVDMKPGDYLVAPIDEATPRTLLTEELLSGPPMTLIRTDFKHTGLPDLFCTARPSHFYGVPFAWLPMGPWTLTRNCTNQIDVYQAE